MSEIDVKNNETEQPENEPIYYSPSRLSLIASLASWLSWFIAAVFVFNTITQGMALNSQLSEQGLSFSEVLSNPNFLSYFTSTLLTPFFTGFVFFIILQAASIGLNVLLEMDFNAREK